MQPPTPDLVKRALEQVLASSLFARADRQSRFLRHIVERKLAADDAALRETVIGLEVYDRSPSYDPKEDPIVRVEASRLRGRLREYYETATESECVVIRLPKGSYVPLFEWRVAPPTDAIGPVMAEREMPVPLEKSVAETVPVAKPAKRLRLVIPALLVLAVVVSIGYYRYGRQAQGRPFDSIAVMPFTDLSEKKDLSHLASGLVEQIEVELGTIRDLRVVGDTTVKQEAANQDLRAAARRMGASALLEGTIREENRKVRVTVRLFDGETGAAIWSSSFDGDRGALFEFEEKIAAALTARLNVHLEARREGIGVRRDPKRAKAYEYLEEARTEVGRETVGTLDTPYSLLQQALATDPNYGAAHAAMAALLIQGGGPLDGWSRKQMALREVQRALELDPALPSAHSAEIVYYRDLEPNLPKARELCDIAERRYPNAALILDSCSTIEGDYLAFGREVELARRAMLIDPLSSRPHSGLMMALYRAGQFDEALKEADTAQRMAPANYFVRRHRALILAGRGELGDALRTIDAARAELGGEPENWMTVRGYILGRLGRRSEAEQLLREYVGQGASDANLSVIYLGMGERARSLDLMEHTYEINRSALAHVMAQYFCRTLDGEPRFEALKRKLGIQK